MKIEEKKSNKQYLAFDIGCIECGEDSNVIGLYATRKKAEQAIEKYITNEPNEFGTDWGRPEWRGQHICEIFEIDSKVKKKSKIKEQEINNGDK